MNKRTGRSVPVVRAYELSPEQSRGASQTFDIVNGAVTARERSCDFFTVP
jgi:hypothetical protein